MKNFFQSGLKFKLVKAVALILALVALFALSAMCLAACDDDGKNFDNDNNNNQNANNATLIFADEFDGASLDEEKWFVHCQPRSDGDPGEVRRGGWWTRDSVKIDDGKLVITTTYDDINDTFYTGSVDTKQTFVYGYYEARCKLPEAKGLWSAFWIMCDKMGLEEPDATIGGAEIDIFESPFYQGGGVQHAVHTGGYGDKHSNNFSVLPIILKHSAETSNGYEEWHTFALDWQPSGYIFYIDGVETWRTTDNYNIGGVKIDNNISSVPSYIILSVEVGGENGVPGAAPFTPGLNPAKDNREQYGDGAFSVDFLVDYVRVYDKNPY